MPRQRKFRERIAPFIVILLGLGLLVAAVVTALNVWDERGWEPVPCTVSKAELKVQITDDEPAIKPAVEFDYAVAGVPATGSKWGGEPRISQLSANDWEEKLTPLKQNPRTVCFVNPANQWEAILEKPVYTAPAVLGMVAVLLLIMGISGLSKPDLNLILLAMYVIFPVFIGAGCYCFYLAWSDDSVERAPRMVAVPCEDLTIGKFKTTVSPDSRQTIRLTKKRKALYRYQWEGRNWHSEWVNFSRADTLSPGDAQAGGFASCLVDPREPWVAVLDATPGRRWLPPLAGTVFFLAGTGGLYFRRRKHAITNRRQHETEDPSPALPAA